MHTNTNSNSFTMNPQHSTASVTGGGPGPSGHRGKSHGTAKSSFGNMSNMRGGSNFNQSNYFMFGRGQGDGSGLTGSIHKGKKTHHTYNSDNVPVTTNGDNNHFTITNSNSFNFKGSSGGGSGPTAFSHRQISLPLVRPYKSILQNQKTVTGVTNTNNNSSNMNNNLSNLTNTIPDSNQNFNLNQESQNSDSQSTSTVNVPTISGKKGVKANITNSVAKTKKGPITQGDHKSDLVLASTSDEKLGNLKSDYNESHNSVTKQCQENEGSLISASTELQVDPTSIDRSCNCFQKLEYNPGDFLRGPGMNYIPISMLSGSTNLIQKNLLEDVADVILVMSEFGGRLYPEQLVAKMQKMVENRFGRSLRAFPEQILKKIQSDFSLYISTNGILFPCHTQEFAAFVKDIITVLEAKTLATVGTATSLNEFLEEWDNQSQNFPSKMNTKGGTVEGIPKFLKKYHFKKLEQVLDNLCEVEAKKAVGAEGTMLYGLRHPGMYQCGDSKTTYRPRTVARICLDNHNSANGKNGNVFGTSVGKGRKNDNISTTVPETTTGANVKGSSYNNNQTYNTGVDNYYNNSQNGNHNMNSLSDVTNYHVGTTASDSEMTGPTSDVANVKLYENQWNHQFSSCYSPTVESSANQMSMGQSHQLELYNQLQNHYNLNSNFNPNSHQTETHSEINGSGPDSSSSTMPYNFNSDLNQNQHHQNFYHDYLNSVQAGLALMSEQYPYSSEHIQHLMSNHNMHNFENGDDHHHHEHDNSDQNQDQDEFDPWTTNSLVAKFNDSKQVDNSDSPSDAVDVDNEININEFFQEPVNTSFKNPRSPPGLKNSEDYWHWHSAYMGTNYPWFNNSNFQQQMLQQAAAMHQFYHRSSPDSASETVGPTTSMPMFNPFFPPHAPAPGFDPFTLYTSYLRHMHNFQNTNMHTHHLNQTQSLSLKNKYYTSTGVKNTMSEALSQLNQLKADIQNDMIMDDGSYNDLAFLLRDTRIEEAEAARKIANREKEMKKLKISMSSSSDPNYVNFNGLNSINKQIEIEDSESTVAPVTTSRKIDTITKSSEPKNKTRSDLSQKDTDSVSAKFETPQKSKYIHVLNQDISESDGSAMNINKDHQNLSGSNVGSSKFPKKFNSINHQVSTRSTGLETNSNSNSSNKFSKNFNSMSSNFKARSGGESSFKAHRSGGEDSSTVLSQKYSGPGSNNLTLGGSSTHSNKSVTFGPIMIGHGSYDPTTGYNPPTTAATLFTPSPKKGEAQTSELNSNITDSQSHSDSSKKMNSYNPISNFDNNNHNDNKGPGAVTTITQSQTNQTLDKSYFGLQPTPPPSHPNMINLQEHIIDFFRKSGRTSATLDELAMTKEIKTCWKIIGRVPLWKLLKQFPKTITQKQQANSVWLITLVEGINLYANKTEEPQEVEPRPNCLSKCEDSDTRPENCQDQEVQLVKKDDDTTGDVIMDTQEINNTATVARNLKLDADRDLKVQLQ